MFWPCGSCRSFLVAVDLDQSWDEEVMSSVHFHEVQIS
jgi:hypothetical protein